MSKEISTTELLNILNELPPEKMDDYISQYAQKTEPASPFSSYICQNGLSVSDVVSSCSGLISKSYIYDILNGTKKNPSRDILLILCIAAKMDRKSVRRILESYGKRDLYAKDTRDIIIATYINNKNFDISLINDELYKYGLPILGAKQDS